MVKLVPSKRIAPAIIPYICAFLYVLVVVLSIVCVYCIYKHDTTWLVCIVGLIFDFICLFVISKSFSWYKSAELKTANDFVVYNVENIIGVLGRNTTRYHIIRVDDMKQTGKNLILKGYINVYEPMQKANHVKKIIINDITDEGVELISKYFDK